MSTLSVDDELALLLAELERANSGSVDFDWSEEFDFPSFVTTTNGQQCHFTRSALASLHRLARLLHRSRSPSATRIELPEFTKQLRRVTANAFADGLLSRDDEQSLRASKRVLKNSLDTSIETAAGRVTHYFPAWTTGFVANKSFSLGPLIITDIRGWLKLVEIYSGVDDEVLDPTWKDALLGTAPRPSSRRTTNLLHEIDEALGTCDAVIIVPVVGFEMEYSRKLARIVSKTCLDAVSLLHQSIEVFQRQSLYDERLSPLDSRTLFEVDGYLGISGKTNLRHKMGPRQHSFVTEEVNSHRRAIEKVVDGLLSERTATHPKLSARWATALNWFAEGCREPDDAVALAKIGTALDVLSYVGKKEGIIQMACNFINAERGSVVTSGALSMTMEGLIKRVYEYGRSQVLHGNHVDRLKSFADDRRVASQLTGHVLREALIRFGKYEGADADDAFRVMPSRD